MGLQLLIWVFLLSLIQALLFQNELLHHFFIMNLTLCPWHRPTTPPPTYSDTLGEYRRRDLKEERGINASWGTLRALSNPKQYTEDTNKVGKLKGNYSKLGMMRPRLSTWNRLESPNSGAPLCSYTGVPLFTTD